ncbi:type II toxin-antitoxin system ParD family antitoxin, partial [Rhizobiaceae sp. 2RAB30]
MAATEKRTFSLPAEQAAFIDSQVNSGAYATGSEVIRAGLRALQER